MSERKSDNEKNSQPDYNVLQPQFLSFLGFRDETKAFSHRETLDFCLIAVFFRILIKTIALYSTFILAHTLDM